MKHTEYEIINNDLDKILMMVFYFYFIKEYCDNLKNNTLKKHATIISLRFIKCCIFNFKINTSKICHSLL